MFFFSRRKKKKDHDNIEDVVEKGTDEENLKGEISGNSEKYETYEKKDDGIRKQIEQEMLTQDKPVTTGKTDTIRFVRNNCEAIAENERQIAEAKKEYEKVTSYLTDIQHIDMAREDEYREIKDICKSILTLTQERSKYKNRNLTISDAQMRKFEPFEDELVDEIKKMYNAQAYQDAIEGDIKNLKKEKDSLYSQRKEIIAKQNALKGMTKVLAVLIISLIVLLIVIYYATKTDMTLPYLGVVALAGVSAAMLVFESSKNRRDIILVERKINKAITLLNKVKIKYINNINVLDYNCNKFGVKNAKDFEEKWNEYCKMREYEKKFRENTEMLNANNENLVIMLKELGVKDADIWISRCEAIVDSREMVEIRHELNQRRQMLRERIENNEKLKEGIISQLDAMINAHPEIKGELLGIIKEYSNV
ncbi:hypothetical protein DW721_08635 [Clostridium sp. AM27-31LB]|jgi:hypothetical protein|uniref:hypothetical protein n=1 Tax=Clostridium sp. AM27-31LB TaxID=2293026 RepID=UPI000E485BB9|nr:hypothetical protein [Clostridium sp. AM27-31LB]RHT92637.1 hypothetical protein DW721_08635 [Clostridium sp. AM27-31LB]